MKSSFLFYFKVLGKKNQFSNGSKIKSVVGVRYPLSYNKDQIIRRYRRKKIPYHEKGVNSQTPQSQ